MKQGKDKKGKKDKIGASLYQIKVSLREIKPPIWRRVQVPGDITLATLHQVLQIAMGWTNSHLHRFSIGGVDYAEPDPDGHLNFQSDRRARLNHVTHAKQKFEYEYDFGDSWMHDIAVEKTLQPESGATYPFCLAGERACPPEDCGGLWGYQEFLEAIMNPAHTEHEELLAWVGGSFNPEMFDLDAVNASLRRLRV
ncbi:MAG: plasmid pRiA4b ORF-3 family protein [Nitrospira sp. LK70]|nr:plasmid pRiA4b ORF-3 family protein [Nitrospira sp. LK70]